MPFKTTRILIVAALLSGCSLTPTQQKWTAIATGVLIAGAIAAHEADSGKPVAAGRVASPSMPCRVQLDGSCR